MGSQPTPLFVDLPFSASRTKPVDNRSSSDKIGKWMPLEKNEPSSKESAETFCCPCVAYSRTMMRLDEANDKRNGINETREKHWKSPIYPIFSMDCCFFASCCFPLYGYLITDLRYEVREFYSIDGNENRDCYAGCCRPYNTLIQMENEIKGREKCRNPSDASGYTSHPPMKSPAGSSSSSSNVCSKQPSTDTERDECLPCIPEDQSEKCPSTPITRRSSKIREKSIALDPVAPTDATLLHIHDLGKDQTLPALHVHGNHRLSNDTTGPIESALHPHGNHRLSKDTTTLSYPPSIHQLRTDTKAPASPPAVLRHDLFNDVQTSAIQRSNHNLGFDQVNTYRASPEHQIHQDEAVPGAFPASSHDLVEDLTRNQAKSAQPHGLEEEDEVASRPVHFGARHLYEDK